MLRDKFALLLAIYWGIVACLVGAVIWAVAHTIALTAPTDAKAVDALHGILEADLENLALVDRTALVRRHHPEVYRAVSVNMDAESGEDLLCSYEYGSSGEKLARSPRFIDEENGTRWAGAYWTLASAACNHIGKLEIKYGEML